MAKRGWQLSRCLCLLKAILFIILSPQDLEAAIPLLGKTVYAPVYVKQYRNYASVQMFKFEVPQNAHSATWDFMSNASSPNCPHADIDMLIQPAGFPLTLPLNTSFPKDFYLHRTNLQNIRMSSKGKSKSHTVYSPSPGPWFGAAYIVGNTDVVIKKMTDMKCQYILAVNMSVNGYEYIPEIMTGNTNHPQQLFLEEGHTLSYLKFKIGKRTWSYDVYVTQCYWAGVLTDPCPVMLYARSDALPSLSREETLYRNCSKLEPGELCHIQASEPLADTYQYIMILKPGGNLTFSIGVTTEECGDPTPHFFSDSGQQKRVRRFADPDDQVIEPDVKTNYRNSCITAIPLYRTTEVNNNFVTTYALKPSRLEFVENLVPVPSLFARVFYFEVMPGQDTGGTIMFSIEVNISQPKKPSSAQTNLTVCLQRGQIPVQGSSIRCRPENFFQFKSLPDKLNSIARHLPYPEAGIWYLALQQNCYVFNSTTGHNEPASCPHQVILTKFDLHAMPCVNQKCGEYGQCTEYAGASHAFSVCNCKANLKGYACDDWSKAKPRGTQMMYTMMLTLSNLFFIPAIILATYRHRFTEAFIYFANMFFSSFYHACDMGPWSVYTLCIMPYHVLQYCDFLCSILSIWFTLIAVSEIRQPLYSLSHMVAVIALAMAVEWNLHGLLPYILPMVLGILIIVINFAVKSYRRKKWYPGLRRAIVLGVGLLLAVTGICVYTFLETDSNYPYTHSVWHMAMSLSILFFLPGKSISPSLSSGSLNSSSDDFSGSILEFNPSNTNDMLDLVPADRTTAINNDDKDEPLLQDI